MFGEVAWELLLMLYALDTGARQTVSTIASFLDTPKTTTIRWIEYLEQSGLIERSPHPTDKRFVFVGLTDNGKKTMELYLSDTLPSHD